VKTNNKNKTAPSPDTVYKKRKKDLTEIRKALPVLEKVLLIAERSDSTARLKKIFSEARKILETQIRENKRRLWKNKK
jgi:16S rRNA G1207 methylase RsmC